MKTENLLYAQDALAGVRHFIKSNRQLKAKYPKCFRPLKPELMVQSLVFPTNRLSQYEWLEKIYNY